MNILYNLLFLLINLEHKNFINVLFEPSNKRNFTLAQTAYQNRLPCPIHVPLSGFGSQRLPALIRFIPIVVLPSFGYTVRSDFYYLLIRVLPNRFSWVFSGSLDLRCNTPLCP